MARPLPICASQIHSPHRKVPRGLVNKDRLWHASKATAFVFPAAYWALQQEFPLHSLQVPPGSRKQPATAKVNCTLLKSSSTVREAKRALVQLHLPGDAICNVNSSTRCSRSLPFSTFACSASGLTKPNLHSKLPVSPTRWPPPPLALAKCNK